MHLHFRDWLIVEARRRTGANDLYPPLYYDGQYPDAYELPSSAGAAVLEKMFEPEHKDRSSTAFVMLGDPWYNWVSPNIA